METKKGVNAAMSRVLIQVIIQGVVHRLQLCIHIFAMTLQWLYAGCSGSFHRSVSAVIVAWWSCPHPPVLFCILTYKSSLAFVTLLSFYSSDHLYTFFPRSALPIQKYVKH